MVGAYNTLREWVWMVWNYVILYLLSAWYLLKEFSTTHKSPSELPNQKGRVAIVTGGGRGIGLETVRHFLQLDMTVVLAGKGKTHLEDTVAGIRSAGVMGGKAVCLDLDLASMASVRRFAKEFRTLRLPLHVLVNNAGIMFAPYRVTEDGHESHWSINYLGHFLLTHLLLPHLVLSATPDAPARVVSLSSAVHHMGDINFDDIDSKKSYNPHTAYAQSKLALLMFTLNLEERYGGSDGVLVASAVHPGVVASDLFQYVSWHTKFPWLTKTFLKTPQQGSDSVVYCALSPKVCCGGGYYENCTLTSPATAATITEQRHHLWDLTCRQLDIEVFGDV